MPVDVMVPVRELIEATVSVTKATTPVETDPDGGVVLSVHDGTRRWSAACDAVAMVLQGGDHSGAAFPPVAIPPRAFPAPDTLADLMQSAVELGGDPQAVQVAVQVPAGPEDLQVVTFDLGWMRTTHPVVHGDPSDVAGRVAMASDGEAAHVQFDPDALVCALAELSVIPHGAQVSASYPVPPFWLSAGPDGLSARCDWPGYGRSEVTLPDAVAVGQAGCWMPFAAIRQVMACVADRDLVTILVPVGSGELVVQADTMTAVLEQDVPYLDTVEVAAVTRRLLADELGVHDPASVPAGEVCREMHDGRMWVVFAGHPVAVDCVGGADTTVTATVWLREDGMAVDAALVNMLNGSARAGRVFINDAGQLVAAADLMGLPDADSIRRLLGRLVRHREMIAPFVTAADLGMPG